MVRSYVPLFALGCGVVMLGSTACSDKSKSDAAWKLPIEAKQLPGTTTVLEAEVIEGTREADDRIKKIFTAAELGAEICRIHGTNPAGQLAQLESAGTGDAKRFFSPANITAVQSLLQCGGLLASNLDGNFQTAITFTDDAGTSQEVAVIRLKMADIPTSFGFSKHAFSGIDGFCRTTDTSKPNAPTIDCGANNDAALKQGSSWFFGTRSALESIAHSLVSPKPDLTTRVAALNDAANATEGLSATDVSADVTTSKPFLVAPCEWGGAQTPGRSRDFVSACFPNIDGKLIQEMDTKVRAAGFEIEDAVAKAGAVHGNIVLVARDDDAAKLVEKDASDLMVDWKSTLENNEAKLIKQARTNPVTRQEKRWAFIVDNFIHALEKAKVSRDGRTVRIAFNEPLDSSDQKDLDDADAKTAEQRAAIADVLEAIAGKKPVPADALAKIVGAPWATYLVALSTFDPKALPASCAAAFVQPKGKTPVPPDPSCVAPVEPPRAQYGVANAAKNAP